MSFFSTGILYHKCNFWERRYSMKKQLAFNFDESFTTEWLEMLSETQKVTTTEVVKEMMIAYWKAGQQITTEERESNRKEIS